MVSRQEIIYTWWIVHKHHMRIDPCSVDIHPWIPLADHREAANGVSVS